MRWPCGCCSSGLIHDNNARTPQRPYEATIMVLALKVHNFSADATSTSTSVASALSRAHNGHRLRLSGNGLSRNLIKRSVSTRRAFWSNCIHEIYELPHIVCSKSSGVAERSEEHIRTSRNTVGRPEVDKPDSTTIRHRRVGSFGGSWRHACRCRATWSGTAPTKRAFVPRPSNAACDDLAGTSRDHPCKWASRGQSRHAGWSLYVRSDCRNLVRGNG